MIIVVVIGPEAPGLRAIPSKALLMPRDCEKAPPIAAMAKPNAALAATIPKYRNSASDFVATSTACATALKATSRSTTANPTHTSFLPIHNPPFLSFQRTPPNRLMRLLFRPSNVDHRQQHEYEPLNNADKDP